jgi:hypothetical protein
MQSSRQPPAQTRFGQYLTRRANQRHSFIIAQSVKRPSPRNSALPCDFGQKFSPTIEVALARGVRPAETSWRDAVEETMQPIDRLFLSIAAHHDTLAPDTRCERSRAGLAARTGRIDDARVSGGHALQRRGSVPGDDAEPERTLHPRRRASKGSLVVWAWAKARCLTCIQSYRPTIRGRSPIAFKARKMDPYIRMFSTQFSLKGGRKALFATTSVRMWRICVANRSVSNRSTRSGRGPVFT